MVYCVETVSIAEPLQNHCLDSPHKILWWSVKQQYGDFSKWQPPPSWIAV